MDQKNIDAIHADIAMWRENARAEKAWQARIEYIDSALCALFYGFESARHCEGCPVSQKTGKRFCVGTPKHAAVNGTYIFDTTGNREPLERHSLEMADFLASLLEGGE